MAVYVIGDIQGCDDSFKALLKKIHFKANSDQLLLVGDLVNRGPKSVDVLQRIMDYGNAVSSVLGNHDITALAVYAGFVKPKKTDTFNHILSSQEVHQFIQYLRHLPMTLEYSNEFRHCFISHAGLHPLWSCADAKQYDLEIQAVFQDTGHQYLNFLKVIFGNQPNAWHPELIGHERLRYFINCFTRMRFLHADLSLNFKYKAEVAAAPAHLKPWFSNPPRIQSQTQIIYGHWAALGLHQTPHSLCIDTGCVWGNHMTAVRIDTPTYEFTRVNAND